jgi:hypothetical protein
MFIHRTYCDVLEEMRQILNNTSFWSYKRNLLILLSLIEECQVYGNRMEAGLGYKRDIQELYKKRKKLQTEVKALKNELPDNDEEDTRYTVDRISQILDDEEDY